MKRNSQDPTATHGCDEVPIPARTQVITNWREASFLTVRTRRQWELSLRKVRVGEKPKYLIQLDPTIPTKIPLFSFAQTNIYRPKPRTLAYLEYEKIFLEPSRKDRFLYWNPDDEEWHHQVILPFDPPYRFMGATRVRQHLNGKNKFGVCAGDKTRFVAIDLDYHGRDRQVFLEQARILLEKFHTGTWHYQIAETDINGLHLIRTYDRRFKTDQVLKGLRELLGRFDEAYPELAARAEAASMPTFAKLELFPQETRGFRLPLCPGRTLLLDRPLKPIQSKKGPVQDVESYIAWINDPHRQRMSVDDMMALIEANLAAQSVKSGQTGKSSGVIQPPKTGSNSSKGLLGPLKGEFRSKLIDFYTGNLQIRGSLNEGICHGATACWIEQIPETEAVDLLMNYLLEIPDPTFSSRLIDQDQKELRRVVISTVKNVYSCHDQPQHKQDYKSIEKLVGVREAWLRSGFLFSNKSSWSNPVSQKKKEIIWTEKEKERIVRILKQILKRQDEDQIIRIASDIVLTVFDKEITKNGLSINYWKDHLSRKFNLKFGHHGKMNSLLDACVQLDLITVSAQSQFYSNGVKGKAKRYAVHRSLRSRII